MRWSAMAAVLVLVACSSAPKHQLEPLSVTLADIQPAQMGLLEQEYALKIRVQNPNNIDIAIDGLSYQIDLNGKQFANGVSRQSTAVPAFGQVLLDATAVGNLGAIMSQVTQIQRRGMPEAFTYRLRGKLASGQDAWRFDSRGHIELPGFAGSTY